MQLSTQDMIIELQNPSCLTQMGDSSPLPVQNWRCVCMRAGWASSQGGRSEAGNEEEAFWSFLTEMPFKTGFLYTLVAAAYRKAGEISCIIFGISSTFSFFIISSGHIYVWWKEATSSHLFPSSFPARLWHRGKPFLQTTAGIGQ